MKILIWLLLFHYSLLASSYLTQDVYDHNKTTKRWVALPYAFSTTAAGTNFGAIAMFNGYLQKSISIVTSAYIGLKTQTTQISPEILNPNTSEPEEARASGFFIGINGIRIPHYRRWLLSGYFYSAYAPNQSFYLDGSNDSTVEKNRIQIQGYNTWGYMDIRYVLPMGVSRKKVLPIIHLTRGIADNQAMPKEGQSTIGISPFYHYYNAEIIPNQPSLNSNGISLYLEHEHTNFPSNPSNGFRYKLEYTQDFGILDSSRDWNNLYGSFSFFKSFAPFSFSSQNTLALNIQSAYSPSFNYANKENPIYYEGQEPFYGNSSLGGSNRMRAYDSNRFFDKAMLYYSAEYRMVIKSNPLEDQEILPTKIDWFQVVAFVEAAKVNPSYNIAQFHQDMKLDVGLSLRALAAKIPVRFDIAYGEEGTNLWVMLKHPF